MRTTTLIMTIGILFMLTACSGANSKNEQILGKLLDLEDVTYTDITFKNDHVSVTYETSSADTFDDKIIADWATIFAYASEFDIDTVTIINEVNGEAVAELTTTKEQIEAMYDGSLAEEDFWTNMGIQAR